MPSRSTSKTAANFNVKASQAYHHGDLRQALIGAAREALENSAPEEITLKSLALRLGVSQPAPYRHFSSREALLAAVATDGFERFRAALSDAREHAAPGEAFLRSALAYVDFGRANRGVYRLMFASPMLATTKDNPLATASNAAFDFLAQGVAASGAPADRVYSTAVFIWSALHGLVMLESVGVMGGPAEHRVTAEEVIRRMVGLIGS